jgi:hypothetical protein
MACLEAAVSHTPMLVQTTVTVHGSRRPQRLVGLCFFVVVYVWVFVAHSLVIFVAAAAALML